MNEFLDLLCLCVRLSLDLLNCLYLNPPVFFHFHPSDSLLHPTTGAVSEQLHCQLALTHRARVLEQIQFCCAATIAGQPHQDQSLQNHLSRSHMVLGKTHQPPSNKAKNIAAATVFWVTSSRCAEQRDCKSSHSLRFYLRIF